MSCGCVKWPFCKGWLPLPFRSCVMLRQSSGCQPGLAGSCESPRCRAVAVGADRVSSRAEERGKGPYRVFFAAALSNWAVMVAGESGKHGNL
jgi:hypothetical protein